MKRNLLQRPLIPVSIFAVLLAASLILYTTCSFAESKRPDRGSVNFGAAKQPDIKTPPHLEAFKTIFADLAEKVVPTVVQVIPTKIDTVLFTNNPFYQFFGDQFGFEDFFGQSQPQHYHHWGGQREDGQADPDWAIREGDDSRREPQG